MSEEKTQVITVGEKVAPFELETFDPAACKFGRFSLADALKKGRWTVLGFYPADFTQERLLKDVKYPMAADARGRLAQALGAYDYKSGLAYRGTFVINPDGVLAGAEVNLNNVGRDMAELVRKMKAFEHTYKHPAEVCPAKWKPGEKTLKPSEKLVGKVGEELK